MTDQELLTAAAKAAGIEGSIRRIQAPYSKEYYLSIGKNRWNPLESDGDALRLAVKLGLSFDRHITGYDEVVAGDFRRTPVIICPEPVGNDPYAATRRAIVRAAAEIGKDMK